MSASIRGAFLVNAESNAALRENETSSSRVLQNQSLLPADETGSEEQNQRHFYQWIRRFYRVNKRQGKTYTTAKAD